MKAITTGQAHDVGMELFKIIEQNMNQWEIVRGSRTIKAAILGEAPAPETETAFWNAVATEKTVFDSLEAEITAGIGYRVKRLWAFIQVAVNEHDMTEILIPVRESVQIFLEAYRADLKEEQDDDLREFLVNDADLEPVGLVKPTFDNPVPRS